MTLDRYADALGLWRGGAGGGLTHRSTALPIFAAIDDELYAACTESAELAVVLSRPTRVLTALQLAASMAPFHEPVQAGLISTLGATRKTKGKVTRYRVKWRTGGAHAGAWDGSTSISMMSERGPPGSSGLDT